MKTGPEAGSLVSLASMKPASMAHQMAPSSGVPCLLISTAVDAAAHHNPTYLQTPFTAGTAVTMLMVFYLLPFSKILHWCCPLCWSHRSQVCVPWPVSVQGSFMDNSNHLATCRLKPLSKGTPAFVFWLTVSITDSQVCNVSWQKSHLEFQLRCAPVHSMPL